MLLKGVTCCRGTGTDCGLAVAHKEVNPGAESFSTTKRIHPSSPESSNFDKRRRLIPGGEEPPQSGIREQEVNAVKRGAFIIRQSHHMAFSSNGDSSQPNVNVQTPSKWLYQKT